MTHALVKREESQQLDKYAFEPNSFGDMLKFAEMVSATNMAPKGLGGKPNEIAMVLLKGRELGLPMMTSLNEIFPVEGRVGCSAKLKMALCLAHPLCEVFQCVETTDNVARFVAKRRGGAPVTVSYTIEQAKQAGLLDKVQDPSKNVWNKYRADMLLSKAKGKIADLVFPDVVGGLATKEDVIDIETGEVNQVVQFVAPPVPKEEEVQDAEMVKPLTEEEMWSLSISQCSNVEQLEAVGADMARKLENGSPLRKKMQPVYVARLKELKG